MSIHTSIRTSARRSLRRSLFIAGVAAGALLASGAASAEDYSFTGHFSADDDVQLFNFTAGGTSSVVLRTWSYAGGTNAAGDTIARGGFDPILALFDGTGAYVSHNDDGGCGYVAHDSVTGACWDTYFTATLAAGNYTVAVMQYDNFAIRPNLSDGFQRTGEGNFTAGWCSGGAGIFCDVNGDARDSHWAFDILGVEGASVVPPNGAVPEPATWAMLITGFGLVGGMARRQQKAPQPA